MKPYPWHETAWQQIEQRLAAGRLAHGLLLLGPAGSGADDFARQLAARLLEADESERARALLAAGSHPDLLVVEPAEEGKAIKVDAIRGLIDFLSLTPQYGSRKIAMIHSAEAMNRHAANTLLKTLEEPPAHGQLILVSQQPGLLPVTIRSRCQKLDLTPYTGEQTREWLSRQLDDTGADPVLLLAIAGNAPLAAIDLADEQGLPLRDQLIDDLAALREQRADAIETAERWNKAGAVAVFAWLYRLVSDCVRCQLLGSDAAVNHDLREQLSRLTAGCTLRQVIDYHDLVIRDYHLLTGPFSPNTVVLLEDFILRWQGTVESTNS